MQAAAVAEKGAEVDADAVTAEPPAEGKRGKDDDEEIDGIKGKTAAGWAENRKTGNRPR